MAKKPSKAAQAISAKIKKIEAEGIRGKKVSHDQAVGAAYGIIREEHPELHIPKKGKKRGGKKK